MMQETSRRFVNEFFRSRLGIEMSDDFRGVIHVPEIYRGATSNMDHVAVAVGYNGFVGKTCCMHVVIQKPEALTPRIVREAFEFPFVVCGCVAVLGMVDSLNDAALDFDRRLGFKEIDRIEGAGLDGDLVILRMLRSDCRWLRPH